VNRVLAEQGFDLSEESRDDGDADVGIVRVFERRSHGM
jgi:hypothetical protein